MDPCGGSYETVARFDGVAEGFTARHKPSADIRDLEIER